MESGFRLKVFGCLSRVLGVTESPAAHAEVGAPPGEHGTGSGEHLTISFMIITAPNVCAFSPNSGQLAVRHVLIFLTVNMQYLVGVVLSAPLCMCLCPLCTLYSYAHRPVRHRRLHTGSTTM